MQSLSVRGHPIRGTGVIRSQRITEEMYSRRPIPVRRQHREEGEGAAPIYAFGSVAQPALSRSEHFAGRGGFGLRQKKTDYFWPKKSHP
jgi:hypothetical protein